MESAFSGIRVVELGIAIQGPLAGMYLAEHGADVIKIETPVGEENRHHFGYGKSLPKAVPAPQFVANNRGKRLMTPNPARTRPACRHGNGRYRHSQVVTVATYPQPRAAAM